MTVLGYRQHSEGTERSLTRVWLVLVAITIGSWTLAPAHITHVAQASAGVTALVLALTFIKSRMIIGHFMEVHTAPRWLRRATDGWLAALIGAIFVIYLF
ncbi:cytochrome C oxidase subunit IV family protein [Mycolicibacter sinensis]|jgi:hypothetical protein|uniref:Prokaryotic cytochrome C oxidase subunit IV family protein n=1 Tax=Mycolicibacter sinensis (strain JDM601) TaxID=875328 RepID=A0A1A2EPW8_MYCSD|nr:cytochrome C oxidase subunit IV family protein [Mycolicibacter sinensis]OBG04241.1 prokaryotic cytochrome C oxidase subunit IV family protein [Mycolicibacter sinensis]OBG07152.1 prokaryotic cytochrome C oxidase subunit IV family protein [Mycolicibacter sinensis]